MRTTLIGLAALATAGSANAAVLVNFTQGASPLPTGYSVFENFESYTNGQLLAGATNARAYSATTANVAARPAFNSTGNFGAALGGAPSSYAVSFAAATGFSFVLGSLDAFNSLTLLYANGTQQVFNGAQIALGADADGNQVQADSNGRVTYLAQAGDPSITGAIFRSNGYSFEFDDLATLAASPVPEPATWAMFVLGFGIAGRAMRHRRKTSAVSFN
ncbi:MAG: PEPxxWA-CTERM sorting domain-containing protein [Sphingomonadales bacterium]